jgi:hypothetical protein
LAFFLPLHRFEQQSAFAEHEAPLGLQQERSVLQSTSAQSRGPSQSLSRLSVQVDPATSEFGGFPQSPGQLHLSSPVSHTLFPQLAGAQAESRPEICG